MRACWSALHREFTQFIHTLKADMDFKAARQRRTALAPFSEPRAIVAFLNDPHGSLDAKDNLLATLVTMAQEDAAGELAAALLWLGLWPGLDRLFLRRVKGNRAEEVLSSLAAAFSVVVSRLDIDRVTRVAATLLRNTEREMRDEGARECAAARRVEPLHGEEQGPAGGIYPDLDLAQLRVRLSAVVGRRDAALLVRVLVLGETCREAAEHMDISYELARKRAQRAIARVRRWLSQSDELDRVSPDGGTQ